MNGQINFDCHEFLDNTSLCILEISMADRDGGERKYEWLLIKKSDLSITPMQLQTKDGSNAVQERYFNLGFLKYDSKSGVFIEAQAKDLHDLEHKGCDEIPKEYLMAVEEYLAASLISWSK